MLVLTRRQGNQPESGTHEGVREKGVVMWETKCIPCSSVAFLHTTGICMVFGENEVLLFTVSGCLWVIIFTVFDFCLVCHGVSGWWETYLERAALQLRGAPPLSKLTHCPHLKLTHSGAQSSGSVLTPTWSRVVLHQQSSLYLVQIRRVSLIYTMPDYKDKITLTVGTRLYSGHRCHEKLCLVAVSH